MSDFDWDKGNLAHLAEHGVSSTEFEEAMATSIDLSYDRINDEERFHSVGITLNGKLLFMAWTIRNDKIRPVTAFNASRTVRNEWERKR